MLFRSFVYPGLSSDLSVTENPAGAIDTAIGIDQGVAGDVGIFVDLCVAVDPGVAVDPTIPKGQGISGDLGVIGKVSSFEDVGHCTFGR